MRFTSRFFVGVFALVLGSTAASTQPNTERRAPSAQDDKAQILSFIDKNQPEYAGVAKQIWDLAEVGYQELKSSALLQKELAAAGFKVEAGVAGMPTGFVASYGSGGPVVGILAEFDALPGITQDASPERHEMKEKAAGHACGHHLFGIGSTAAAIAVKDWLARTGAKGTIRLYGTPAEEGGAGKVYMVREGLFKEVDVVLHWHASDRNDASPGSSLANKSAKFRFHGISAHAKKREDLLMSWAKDPDVLWSAYLPDGQPHTVNWAMISGGVANVNKEPLYASDYTPAIAPVQHDFYNLPGYFENREDLSR